MKGLMVTLLVVFGSGTSLAQQFGGNDTSANRTNQSANQSSSRLTPQTRLQPLNRSFDRTSMRVAQSSSTGDSGFSPTSSQTIGGTNYKDGDSSPSTTVPIDTPDKDGLYGGQGMRAGQGMRGGGQGNRSGQQQNAVGRQSNPASGTVRTFPSNQTSPARSNTTSGRSSSVGQSYAPQLRAWPLPVSPEWERTLKAEGYIYAPIKQHEQNSIGEVVMFQDGTQFGNPSGAGSNVTPNQWEVYKDTAIIDVNDFSLQEIQKGTLTLRDLGAENLTGVALRYVGEDGNKIDVRRIGNIPGNATPVQTSSRSDYASRNDFGQNQPIAIRGSRANERQFNTSGQRDVSFSDRNLRQDDRRDFDSPAQDSVGNGEWNLNDNQRIRQPRRSRQTFQRDDRSLSRRDSRDRFENDDQDRFGNDIRDRFGDNRDFSRSNDRRLSSDYLDSLQRRDFDQRDRRDVDYVRNSINQNRSDDYLLRSEFGTGRQRRDTYDDDRYSRSNLASGSRRDGRSTDYDANFAEEKRELEERYLAAKRLEVKDAEEAAWRKHQRESMDQARLVRMYEDDLTTPLSRRSTISSNYPSRPFGFGADRLADRSTDPIYRGQRADALSPVTTSNASADRVAQILAEKEADLDAKIGAIDHLMKLDSASRNLDSKINSLKNVNPQNNSQGRVKSLVPNTLGGDLAAPRHARLASANSIDTHYDGLNGGAPPMNINGFGQNRQRNRGGSSFGSKPTSGAGDGRMLRLMWLLLLISLGVNFYLALLSRSFYTQYEELADELRETFSTSSSISSPRSSSISSSRPSSRHSQRDSSRHSQEIHEGIRRGLRKEIRQKPRFSFI